MVVAQADVVHLDHILFSLDDVGGVIDETSRDNVLLVVEFEPSYKKNIKLTQFGGVKVCY